MSNWGIGAPARAASPLAVDPRENTVEFRRLPKQAREDLREHWRKQDREAVWTQQRRRGYLYQSMVEGIVLLVLTEWMFWGLGWWSAFACLGLGAALGALWQRFVLGPGVSAMAAIGCFLLVRFLCGGNYLLGAVASIVVITCGAMMMRITRQSEAMGA